MITNINTEFIKKEIIKLIRELDEKHLRHIYIFIKSYINK